MSGEVIPIRHLAVARSLRNAEANGYSFQGVPDIDIAIDLTTYDAAFEAVEPEELLSAIAYWRRTHAR